MLKFIYYFEKKCNFQEGCLYMKMNKLITQVNKLKRFYNSFSILILNLYKIIKFIIEIYYELIYPI